MWYSRVHVDLKSKATFHHISVKIGIIPSHSRHSRGENETKSRDGTSITSFSGPPQGFMFYHVINFRVSS